MNFLGFSVELWISTIAAAASAGGLLFLAIQTLNQTRLARAQFVNSLSDSADLNIDLEVELEAGCRLYEPVPEVSKLDHQNMVRFLSFFDKLYQLLRLDVITLAIVDPLFSYRFFILVHNPNVQKFELLGAETHAFWTSVFRLHKMWYAYRVRHRLPILRPEGAEALRNDSVYKNCKP
jgi:hypothetical protein